MPVSMCENTYGRGMHLGENMCGHVQGICALVCVNICVTLYVSCTCVGIYLCLCCLMFVHTSVWIPICVDGLCDCIKQTNMWIYSCTCVFACVYVCLCLLVLHECDFLLAYANVYFCDCWCLCICMCMCGDAWGCPYECFPIPTCMYVHMLTSVSVNVCSS